MKKARILSLFVFIILSGICFSCNNTKKGKIQLINGEYIDTAQFEKFITSQMDSLALPALSIAVINNNKVVFHKALGVANVDTQESVDNNSIYEVASLSKPIFSYFVLKYVDRGLINFDTPLYKYMPYPDIEQDKRYQLITARMALSHQTGFPNWRYFEMADTSLHINYGDLYLKFTPGTQFAYSGEGYLYLAKVIASLNNCDLQTLDNLFQKEVAEPMGMNHAYFSGNEYISKHKIFGHKQGKVFYKKWPTSFPDQDSSTFGAAGGLHTNAIDYAKFLIGLSEKKGLSASSYNEMFKAQVLLPKEHSMYQESGNAAWGLGIAIRPTPFGIIYEHGGNNGNFQSGFILSLDKKIGYVFLTNCDQGHSFNEKLSVFFTKQK